MVLSRHLSHVSSSSFPIDLGFSFSFPVELGFSFTFTFSPSLRCSMRILFLGVSIALFSGDSGRFVLLEGIVEFNVLLFAVATRGVLEREEYELASFYNHDSPE